MAPRKKIQHQAEQAPVPLPPYTPNNPINPLIGAGLALALFAVVILLTGSKGESSASVTAQADIPQAEEMNDQSLPLATDVDFDSQAAAAVAAGGVPGFAPAPFLKYPIAGNVTNFRPGSSLSAFHTASDKVLPNTFFPGSAWGWSVPPIISNKFIANAPSPNACPEAFIGTNASGIDNEAGRCISQFGLPSGLRITALHGDPTAGSIPAADAGVNLIATNLGGNLHYSYTQQPDTLFVPIGSAVQLSWQCQPLQVSYSIISYHDSGSIIGCSDQFGDYSDVYMISDRSKGSANLAPAKFGAGKLFGSQPVTPALGKNVYSVQCGGYNPVDGTKGMPTATGGATHVVSDACKPLKYTFGYKTYNPVAAAYYHPTASITVTACPASKRATATGCADCPGTQIVNPATNTCYAPSYPNPTIGISTNAPSNTITFKNSVTITATFAAGASDSLTGDVINGPAPYTYAAIPVGYTWASVPGMAAAPNNPTNDTKSYTFTPATSGDFTFIPDVITTGHPSPWQDQGKFVTVHVNCPGGSTGATCTTCNDGFGLQAGVCTSCPAGQHTESNVCKPDTQTQSCGPANSNLDGTQNRTWDPVAKAWRPWSSCINFTCISPGFTLQAGACQPVSGGISASGLDLKVDNANSVRVRPGENVNLSWTGNNLPASTGCNLYATPLVSSMSASPTNVHTSATGSSVPQTEGPIQSATIFTLDCGGSTDSASVTVVPDIIPI
jgi:hypothetical protein